MSSRPSKNMNGLLKFILSLIVLTIQISSINAINTNIKVKYIYLTNNKKLLEEQLIDKKYEDNCKSDNLLISRNNKLYSESKTFNIEMKGETISVSGNIFSNNNTYSQKKEIFKYLYDKYIDKLELNLQDVYNIEINKKSEATPKIMNLSNVSNKEEIAFMENELLGLDIKVDIKYQQVIEPETIIKNDDSLYFGEEVTEPGIYGSKVVFKEITYNGTAVKSETVESVQIVRDSAPTIITKGCKDPYKAGVQFLLRPTNGGYLSSYFGEPRASSYHKGIDIAKQSGEDVFSALEGKVVYAGFNDGGYGNLIIVEHNNNFKTYYAHLSNVFINVGDVVKKGEVIGSIGSTGYSTGPHLHFELRVNNEPVNPINYIID